MLLHVARSAGWLASANRVRPALRPLVRKALSPSPPTASLLSGSLHRKTSWGGLHQHYNFPFGALVASQESSTRDMTTTRALVRLRSHPEHEIRRESRPYQPDLGPTRDQTGHALSRRCPLLPGACRADNRECARSGVHPARILRALQDAVESHLGDQLRPRKHHVPPPNLSRQELPGLPLQRLIRHAFEGLPLHYELPLLLAARRQMQIAEFAIPASAAPLGGGHDHPKYEPA